MFNYLRAEVYRILHKRSFYIYFGALAVAYILFVYMRISTANENSIIADAGQLFFLLPAAVGGYLFAALFNDDLNSKSLSTLIGFGMGKAKIVLSKLVLMALFCAVIFGLIPLLMAAIYAVFGHMPSAESLRATYIYALVGALSTFVYAAIAAIVAYGLQRATFAIVIFLLLGLGVVDQLLGMLFGWDMIASLLPNLREYLISGITMKIQIGLLADGLTALPWIEYGIYVATAAILAVFVFNRKELEF